MSGLEAHEKIITGRRSMTQNINDTMAKQRYKTMGVPSSDKVCSSLSRSPNGAGPQKDAFNHMYIKKKFGGGFMTTNFPRPFVRGNDVAESYVSLSLASKIIHIATSNV